MLKGCRIGGLAVDPEVVANEALRKPIEQAFIWMTERFAAMLREAQAAGRLLPSLDAGTVATTILAVRQGSYILARAAGSTEPYERAIDGLIELLTQQAAGQK